MKPENKSSGLTRSYTEIPSQKETTLLTSGKMRAAFWVVASFLVGLGIWQFDQLPFDSLLAYYLILFASLLPTGLWTYERSHGTPIYPCFCAFQFLAFGTPLIGHHKGVFFYSSEQQLTAAIAISLSLTVGTLFWLAVTSKNPPPPSHYRKINLDGGDSLLITFMLLSLFFNLNIPFQLVYIAWKYLSLLQPFCNGLSTLAAFILAYRIGTGKATRRIQVTFIITLVLNTIIMNTSLYLSTALPSLALALGGYALGKHKIPWFSAILVVGITYLLHAGKNEMRTRHWDTDKNVPIKTIKDVTEFYSEWIDVAFDEMQKPKDDDSGASLLERNSLLHLTLFMQEKFDAGLPHMNGDTYVIIPELLVPRILNPDKLWSLEGTTRINIHFGLQTREDTLTTTIGWGMLNEGYANFGLGGMVLICSFLGLFLGMVGHYSSGCSIFSSRTLMAIMILSVVIQTENTAGVFVTTMFQTAVALAVFSFTFMKVLPHEEEVLFTKTSIKSKKPKRPVPAKT